MAPLEDVEAWRLRRIAGGGARIKELRCTCQCWQLESRDVGGREPSEVARVRKCCRWPGVTEPERETSVAPRHSTLATSRSTLWRRPAHVSSCLTCEEYAVRRLSWPCSPQVHFVSHRQRRRGYGVVVYPGRRWIGRVVWEPVLLRGCLTMCAFLGAMGWSGARARVHALSPACGPGTYLTW